MRVATVTHQAPMAVWCAPYRRTLYEFLHIEQHERLEDLRLRGNDLHRAGLLAMAFHEPKRLGEEHRRLLAEFRPKATAVSTLEDAQALLNDVMTIDRAGGWRSVIQ